MEDVRKQVERYLGGSRNLTVPIRNDTQDRSHRIEPQQILIEGAGIPRQELSRHRFDGTAGVQLSASQDHEVSNEVGYISVYGT
jgi:hypothetical protein